MVFVLAASFYSVSLSEPVQRKCVLCARVSPGCFGVKACKAQCSRSPSLDPPKRFKLTLNEPFPSSGKFRHLTRGDKAELIHWLPWLEKQNTSSRNAQRCLRALETGLIHRPSLILDLGKGQHLMLEVAVLLGRPSSASLLPHSFGNAVHM